ncbi:MAG: lipocalin family protein [Desulfobacterales bacterium]|jgi:apolipoprotein D and lipocalin family protein
MITKSLKIHKSVTMSMSKTIPALILLFALTGCTTGPPIHTVESVDIERFMGDWYVIANIPHDIEKGAHNAIESYRLAEDGTVETTFTFNKGGFDGPLKTYKPRGFIQDKESNAVWGMQFFWPIKAEYRIIYLTEDYSQTVIGRTKRDYVWIMARKPYIPENDYNRILDFLQAQGYDISKVQKVPQQVK